MLSKGAQVTALVCSVAAQEGHAEIVDILWNKETQFRDIMLYWGCMNGHKKVVEVYGSLVMINFGDHMTPLHIATLGGHRLVIIYYYMTVIV